MWYCQNCGLKSYTKEVLCPDCGGEMIKHQVGRYKVCSHGCIYNTDDLSRTHCPQCGTELEIREENLETQSGSGTRLAPSDPKLKPKSRPRRGGKRNPKPEPLNWYQRWECEQDDREDQQRPRDKERESDD